MNVRALALLMLAPLTAHAHLMVAQHGTLNLVGDGAFLVLSLPASAFAWADDDGDGRLSASEFAAHQPRLQEAVKAGVTLEDEHGLRPLDGLLLGLSPDDDAQARPAAQLVALGRFGLASPSTPLTLGFTLLGTTPDARSEAITVTRGDETQLALFTPARGRLAVLPSGLAVLADAFALGARHILEGVDHLLFLLVVLAAGGGLRRIALTLTAFTLGHATTLALSVLTGFELSARLVEPAIALTIVAVARLDWRRPASPGADLPRLALVFGCALIHGLALAGGLRALGLDQRHLAAVLAGFNLGVEAGQLGVIAVAALVTVTLLRVVGRHRLGPAQRLATATSIAVGCVWFVQRVAGS